MSTYTFINKVEEMSPLPKTVVSTGPIDEDAKADLAKEIKTWSENALVLNVMINLAQETLDDAKNNPDAMITLRALKTTSSIVKRCIKLGHPGLKPVATTDGDGGAIISLQVESVLKSVSIMVSATGSYRRGAKYEGSNRVIFDAEDDGELVNALVWLRTTTISAG